MPTIFCTCSIDEYHDYALRPLIHNYAKALKKPSANIGADAILNDDVAFAKYSITSVVTIFAIVTITYILISIYIFFYYLLSTSIINYCLILCSNFVVFYYIRSYWIFY